MFEWLLFEFSFSMIRSLHLVQDVYYYLINMVLLSYLNLLLRRLSHRCGLLESSLFLAVK